MEADITREYEENRRKAMEQADKTRRIEWSKLTPEDFAKLMAQEKARLTQGIK